jgi:hypothetical protein
VEAAKWKQSPIRLAPLATFLIRGKEAVGKRKRRWIAPPPLFFKRELSIELEQIPPKLATLATRICSKDPLARFLAGEAIPLRREAARI